ncbi:MAG: kelch repeat-containing protein [Byssovorax sp.]
MILSARRAQKRDSAALPGRAWILVAGIAAASCAPTGGLDPALDDAPTQSRQALDDKPTWAPTGAMSVARQNATATRLTDGRVLIAGGQRLGSVDVGDVYFESAELFDPVAGKFSIVAAKMATKRSQHAAAVMSNGQVLVVGGTGGAQSTTTAEIFDPKSGAWTSTPPLAHDHWGATLTVLPTGRVLLAGGTPGALGGASELFDPVLGAWTEVASMSTPRRYHTATLLLNGRVLVTGGQAPDDPSKISADAEIWNPTTDVWTYVAPLSIPRTSHTATRFDDGLVVVVGGATPTGITAAVERYNPAQDAWTKLPVMQSARAIHSATLLDGGAVLVAGGLDSTSSELRSSELFDAATERWVVNGLLGHGRVAHTAEALGGGAVLVAGGEQQSSAEIYRPAESGQPCEVDPQCASDHCVDGVCCATACSGTCVTCALAGAEGTCAPASLGTDPHHDCGQGGPCDSVCDPSGACAARVGEACVATSCTADGTQAIEGAACVVVGGACATITVGCAPYRCGLNSPFALFGCLTQCRSIDDCAEGYACDPEGKCRARPDVAATDPETCAAGPRAPGPPSAVAAWLAALAVLAVARRASRRAS